MSRRGRRTAVMTLFSFQDIIMSTSGIILIMVLLLTLQLIQRSASPAQPPDPATPVVDSDTLSRKVQELKSQVDQRTQRLARARERAATFAEISPGELTRETERLREENDRLQSQIAELQVRRRAMEQAGISPEERKQAAELQDNLSQTQRLRAAALKELAALTRGDQRIYVLPHGSRQSGWLVELTGHEITVAKLGTHQPSERFTSSTGLFSRSAVSRFLEWQQQLTGSPFFFLVVKPDGVTAFEEISETFDARHVQYGFDVAGADQQLFSPPREAAE